VVLTKYGTVQYGKVGLGDTEDEFDAVRLRSGKEGWVWVRAVWSSGCAFFLVALWRGGCFTGKVKQVSSNVICGFERQGVVIPRLGEGGGLSFCV